jgi:DNA-binding NtrC family response regulator
MNKPPEKPRLVLVDDDADMVLSLTRALRAAGFAGEIQGAGTVERALSEVRAQDAHVAVIDLSLSKAEGVEGGFRLLRGLISEAPLCRVIVLTGSATKAHGIRALNSGAAHFLEKPPDIPHLLALINDSFQQSCLRRAFSARSEIASEIEHLVVGSADVTQRLREELRFAASTNQSLLLTGETGTGKSLCARAVHLASTRRDARFVRYQPSFGGADLVNSDLFGHEKGAFTGAHESRQGLITQASGGTLFLDEVDELPLETQITLLGVMQDRVYRAVGSNEEREARVRFICASNQDLPACMASGKVRSDFYHRMAHAKIHVPALRERREDIPALVERFLGQLRDREQLSVFECTPQALSLLGGYSWPGNVRELEAVVEGAAYRAQYRRSARVEEGDLRLPSQAAEVRATGGEGSFSERVNAFKIELIREALQRHQGNQAKAAEDLELERSTLRRILARAGENSEG